MKLCVASAAIVIVALLIGLGQLSLASRKFLTGLIIGTLLARNGQQQTPYYPMPSYPSGQQQQPLFIIIPSSSGKSHKPHVLPASHYADARSLSDSSSTYPNNILRRRFFVHNQPMVSSSPSSAFKTSRPLLRKLMQPIEQPKMIILPDRSSTSSSTTVPKMRNSRKRQVSSMTLKDSSLKQLTPIGSGSQTEWADE